MSAVTQRNMAIGSLACGFISVFVGGALLGGVGLALGVIAYRSIRQGLAATNNYADNFTIQSLRMARAGIAVCAVTMVLNFIAGMVMMPYMMEQLGYTSGATTGQSTGSGIF